MPAEAMCLRVASLAVLALEAVRVSSNKASWVAKRREVLALKVEREWRSLVTCERAYNERVALLYARPASKQLCGFSLVTR